MTSCNDPADRCEEELLSIVPRERRKPYKMRRIIELLVDRGSFFEMSASYGQSQISGPIMKPGSSARLSAQRFFGVGEAAP